MGGSSGARRGEIDWNTVERLVVDSATKQLAAFAKQHANDVFYGAIFDVDPDSPSVSLLLNTETYLLKEWKRPVDKKDLHSRFLPGAFEHTLSLLTAFPRNLISERLEQDIDDDATDDEGNYATAESNLVRQRDRKPRGR